MMINSVLSAGMQGLQAGVNRANQAGGRIAQSSASSDDLAPPIVDLKISELQVKASANVIKAADQMLGALIDIKA